jgi:hypothetical protein
MNIVLVCVDNFQEYILINIKQLIRLKHKNIFVITNMRFFNLFNEFKDDIVLVSAGTHIFLLSIEFLSLSQL